MNETTRQVIRTSILLALLTIVASGVFAQSNTGSITGVVTDPNGAVVPNAAVTVTNQGTNEKRTVQSDAEGRYEVRKLAEGEYHVFVEAKGYVAAQFGQRDSAEGGTNIDIRRGQIMSRPGLLCRGVRECHVDRPNILTLLVLFEP